MSVFLLCRVHKHLVKQLLLLLWLNHWYFKILIYVFVRFNEVTLTWVWLYGFFQVATPLSMDTPVKSSRDGDKGLIKKLKGFDGLAMSIGNGNTEKEGDNENRLSHRFVNLIFLISPFIHWYKLRRYLFWYLKWTYWTNVDIYDGLIVLKLRVPVMEVMETLKK